MSKPINKPALKPVPGKPYTAPPPPRRQTTTLAVQGRVPEIPAECENMAGALTNLEDNMKVLVDRLAPVKRPNQEIVNAPVCGESWPESGLAGGMRGWANRVKLVNDQINEVLSLLEL